MSSADDTLFKFTIEAGGVSQVWTSKSCFSFGIDATAVTYAEAASVMTKKLE